MSNLLNDTTSLHTPDYDDDFEARLAHAEIESIWERRKNIGTLLTGLLIQKNLDGFDSEVALVHFALAEKISLALPDWRMVATTCASNRYLKILHAEFAKVRQKAISIRRGRGRPRGVKKLKGNMLSGFTDTPLLDKVEKYRKSEAETYRDYNLGWGLLLPQTDAATIERMVLAQEFAGRKPEKGTNSFEQFSSRCQQLRTQISRERQMAGKPLKPRRKRRITKNSLR